MTYGILGTINHHRVYFCAIESYSYNYLSYMVINRASVAQERQPGTKYFAWRRSQIKTETILSNEQVQEKGFKGML